MTAIAEQLTSEVDEETIKRLETQASRRKMSTVSTIVVVNFLTLLFLIFVLVIALIVLQLMK
jgi:hypothetical protein